MVLTGCRVALTRLMRGCLSHSGSEKLSRTRCQKMTFEKEFILIPRTAPTPRSHHLIVLSRNRDPELEGVSWEEWMETMAFLTLEISRQLHKALTGLTHSNSR